jgi:hypothetical protein
MTDYTIALARSKDLAQLPVIELAAARLLRGHAPESVLNETTGYDELEKALRDGHLWVVLRVRDVDDVPRCPLEHAVL